ncbi:hypothetical protein [Acidicapsa ligni]|uniref:hypothetical protein n=1 Tax=Acidicapsa ligni TaxID=542300 RepID=UPI0021DFC17F|nr:hypothetical protein [Acidicapsa ligni]
MIALVTTCFLVFYILIPGALFRFATSFSSVKLKSFQRTRSQEATFAVAVALLPFAFALAGVWFFPVMRHHPFQIREGTYTERRIDYHHASELLVTSDLSKLLGCGQQPEPCPARNHYWHSVDRVLRRQARFLSWYYIAIFAEGLIFGLSASKYGDWQSKAGRSRHRRFAAAYNWVTRKFILPNISEWHVLLTDFNWPKKDRVLVVADVLQNDGHLYRGRVEDYFIDPDGKLSGILLRNVDRFDLHAYRKAQEESGEIVTSENYWKTIPSENFYISHSAISNLNVRFAPGKTTTFEDLTRDVLQEEDIDVPNLDALENEDESRDTGDPHHPDLYS